MNGPKMIVSAQPEEIDNGDFTITAKWDFSDPSDYILNDTEIQNNRVNLSLETFYWNQTTQGDFDLGAYSDTISTGTGDVILGDEMKTINIISNGEFLSDENWSYVPGYEILSLHNGSSESAELGYEYKIGPKMAYLKPPTSEDDGFISLWQDWGFFLSENSSSTLDIGYHQDASNTKRKRSYLYFDISDIPTTGIVNDVKFYSYLHTDSANATYLFDINAMDLPRFGTIPQDLYIDCSDGNIYIDDSDTMKSGTPVGYIELDLGAQAITDIQNNLSRGWFGLGIHEEGDDDERSRLSSIDSIADHPQINVSYDTVAPVTINEISYVNQTFYKPNVTPNSPTAASLSFDYRVDKFLNCTANLIVEIDGVSVWGPEPILSTTGVTSISLDVGQYLIGSGNYELSLQLHMTVSAQTHTECAVNYDNVNVTTLGYSWSGNYISQEFNAGIDVFWNDISWNYLTDSETDLTMRTRNSPDGLSWEPWTDEYSNPSGDEIPSSKGEKIQFSANLTTSDYSKTPILSDVNISFTKYLPIGSIEMNYDYEPDNLRNWGTFSCVEDLNDQTLSCWYSIDSGNSWNETLDGNLSGVSTTSGKIRFRTLFSTSNGTLTPTLYEWNLTFEISQLSTILGDVAPGVGFIDTCFNFTMRYSDPENDPPINVTLNITSGTSFLGSWGLYEINASDSNYIDGKWYYFNATGFLRGSNYSFLFAAKDQNNVWIEGNNLNGPYVLNSPPKISSENRFGAQGGILYYNDYNAQDLEDESILNWSLLTNASWLQLDPITGNLSGTPPSGDQGSYWVHIIVDDRNGAYDETNFTLVVGDTEPPIANAGEDQTVYEDDVVYLDGTNSTDNIGIINYTWDFGLYKRYGPKPSYIFEKSGTYIVALIVRDVIDNHDVDMVSITVLNIPPIPDAGEDLLVIEGEEVNFNASNSSDTPSDYNKLIYLWEFDGDDDFNDRVGINVTYTWFEPQTTVVKLRVIDDDGETGEDMVNVQINNVPPVVNIDEFYSGEKGSEIIIIASAYDPGNVDLQYRWDWEDDGVWDTNFSYDFIVKHTWAEEGQYTMVVEVWDGNETGSDRANVEIFRFNIPPQLSDLGSRKIRWGVAFPIDLTQFIMDEDTPHSEMVVTTDNPQFVSVNGVEIILSYPLEMVGETVDVLVTVSDGLASDSSILTVLITSNHPPTLDVPFDDVVFNEDGEAENIFNLNNHFSDLDLNDKLRFTIINANPSLIVTKDVNGYISFSTTPNWAGSTIVQFRAWDPSDAFTDASVLVTVNSINDPPIILKQIQSTTVDENGNWTIDLDDHFLDVETSNLTFSCNHPEIKIDPITHEALWIPGDRRQLDNVRFTASDGEHSVSLDPVDLRVVEPNYWLMLIPLIIIFATIFIVYREMHYRYNVEEVFLVDNAGVLLVHLHQWESKAIDAKLVSGMLTAVQEFVKDSFRGANNGPQVRINEGALGKLEYGDFQIVIERGAYTFLSAVISGNDNKRLRKRMKKVVLDFETQYSDVLSDWDGDMGKFEGADRIVGTLLKNHSGVNMVKESEREEANEEIMDEEIIIEATDLPSGDFGDVPSYYDEISEDDPEKDVDIK